MHSNDPPPRRSGRCQTGREIERENLRQQDGRSNPRLPAPSRCRVLKNISFGCFFIRQGYYFVISRNTVAAKGFEIWGADFLSRPRHFCNFPPTNETQKSKNTWARKSTKKQVLLASSKRDDVHKTRLFFFRLLFLSLSLFCYRNAPSFV